MPWRDCWNAREPCSYVKRVVLVAGISSGAWHERGSGADDDPLGGGPPRWKGRIGYRSPDLCSAAHRPALQARDGRETAGEGRARCRLSSVQDLAQLAG
jgi:hypothetical protein